MKNYAEGGDIPLGLGMALAQDIDAMNYFASLSPQRQQEIIAHTAVIRSKQEMRDYVRSLRQGGSSSHM